MSDRSVKGWFPALLFALASCADSGPGPAGAVTVRDSAGVRIVENGPPGAGGSAGEWIVSPEPVVRLGGVDVEGPEQFTRIRDATRLGGGDIVVLEGGVSELRFFTGSGEHLRTAGGLGDGPGEFGIAYAMVRTSADTLIVRDLYRRSRLLFSPAGEYVRQERQDMAALQAIFRSWGGCLGTHLFADGSFFHCMEEPGLPASPLSSDEVGLLRAGTRLLRVTWDLSRIDTLGVYRGKESYYYTPYPGARGWRDHAFFSDGHLVAAADPPLLHVANNPDYSIESWTLDGALKQVIRRVGPGTRRTPTGEEEEAAWEELQEAENEDAGEMRRWRGELPLPGLLPAVRGLAAGPAGELWVQREPFLKMHREALLDVFDGEGRYLGEVRIPSPLLVKEVGEDYILGVRHDEFDVPFVEMYRLRRGG